MTKAKNDNNCREIYFKLENIKMRRFRIYEPCSEDVYIAVKMKME